MKMNTFLIVNADDLGLVPSVSEGILEAHARGIVSSTTMLVTRPLSQRLVRKAKGFSSLGVGIHLNMTLGTPVSPRAKVRSLTDEGGIFRKLTPGSVRRIRARELEIEWTAQILHFKKIWGQYPTHLDSHHHIHVHPVIRKVFLKLASHFKVPFRPPSPRFSKAERQKWWRKGILLPQSFLGNLDAKKYWTGPSLQKALLGLKPGIHELMCHPGFHSKELAGISSFQKGRETELRALTSQKVLRAVEKKNIQLIHFGYLNAR